MIRYGLQIASERDPMQNETSIVEKRLSEMGLTLPPAKEPVANYIGCKQSGDLLYVSGQIGDIRGAVGGCLSVEDGQLCARSAVLHMLRTVKAAIGDLDRIASVDKLLGFVRSAPDFIGQPKVLDGASDLLIAIFGDAGKHSRTATGVLQTPYGSAVQLEMTLRLKALSISVLPPAPVARWPSSPPRPPRPPFLYHLHRHLRRVRRGPRAGRTRYRSRRRHSAPEYRLPCGS